ncbi:ornithine carbamoyltransferase [Athalassotoga saccharophila]|uniref:ornithine carbamoyltransferase n=1 Tax=Athalassotoga saccharophila TaxID=1441386 RepID=UPI0018D9E982|nr:ornithine carbamoyltransferase [Athalassotoga saccharophila]BBJ27946.1 ornithine carbamoyltransferase [Athalassotoga saccharophila]
MILMKGKSIVSIDDLTIEELNQLIDTSIRLKDELYSGERRDVLSGKTLGMIFEKPSLRTRVAFETAMTQLGGHAIYLGPDDIKLGKRETTEDIARVLSSMVDVIMARVFAHKTVEDLAKYSRVPVINGLSDFEHPTQIVGDMVTVKEKFGYFKGIKFSFIGDGNNVANSIALAGAKLGMHVVIASPKGYELQKKVFERSLEISKLTQAKIEITNDPEYAAKDADVIYTDVWASMGQESEAEARKKIFAPYQVNSRIMSLAKKTAIFMHCLPAHYGEEVTEEVGHGPQSVIFEEAENRLHSIKAMIVHVTR